VRNVGQNKSLYFPTAPHVTRGKDDLQLWRNCSSSALRQDGGNAVMYKPQSFLRQTASWHRKKKGQGPYNTATGYGWMVGFRFLAGIFFSGTTVVPITGYTISNVNLENIKSKSKSKSHYYRQLVGQSVLVSGAHLGPATNFSISLRFSFWQLLFVML
jgi:hypothetical protein